MHSGKSTPEQRRRRLIFMCLIVAALFALRVILVNRGVISGPETMSDADLENAIRTTQVEVSVGDQHAPGTIMQVTPASRRSKTDTVYVVTTYEMAAAVQEASSDREDSAAQETSSGTNPSAAGLDSGAKITFKDGSLAEASYVNVDEASDVGIVSSSVNGHDQDSVSFNEDYLYQMQEGSTAAYLAGAADGNLADSVLQKSRFLTRSTQVSGYDGDVMTVQMNSSVLSGDSSAAGDAASAARVQSPDEKGDTSGINGSGSVPAGTGVYTDTGYWLGMVIGEDADQNLLVCAPGNTVVDYFRTHH